jgi:hypothetical protein
MGFYTRYGYYEYLIMLVKIANAPTLFQHITNEIFKDMIDHNVIAYIANIFIYSQIKEEHKKLGKEVLTYLQK